MTDDSNPDLDDRLARLAARRAAASPRPSLARESADAADGESVPAPSARTKRGHPAAAGRILAAGLSSTAFFSVIAALGAQSPASGSTPMAAAPPVGSPVNMLPSTSRGTAAGGRPSKVVVKVVHHTVYVDRYGRPVKPPGAPGVASKPGVGSPGAAPSSSAAGGYSAAPSSPGTYTPAPAGTPTLPAAPSSAPTPSPASPPVSGPTPGTTPHPVQGPSPSPSPAPTPAPPPTAAPAPPTTAPPTTVFTPPPPPSPPACTGSKCP